jgi:hypothetical protein
VLRGGGGVRGAHSFEAALNDSARALSADDLDRASINWSTSSQLAEGGGVVLLEV